MHKSQWREMQTHETYFWQSLRVDPFENKYLRRQLGRKLLHQQQQQEQRERQFEVSS
jgi:hypothetical protein